MAKYTVDAICLLTSVLRRRTLRKEIVAVVVTEAADGLTITAEAADGQLVVEIVNSLRTRDVTAKKDKI